MTRVSVLLLTFWTVGYGASRRASPPPQTAIQQAVFMRKKTSAARLSANATPALLAHMGSNISRSYLQSDCPALAAQNSTAIVARLLEEMAVRYGTSSCLVICPCPPILTRAWFVVSCSGGGTGRVSRCPRIPDTLAAAPYRFPVQYLGGTGRAFRGRGSLSAAFLRFFALLGY